MLPEEEGWDSYKRGAFLEKADRFQKDKPYEGPGVFKCASDMFVNIAKPCAGL